MWSARFWLQRDPEPIQGALLKWRGLCQFVEFGSAPPSHSDAVLRQRPQIREQGAEAVDWQSVLRLLGPVFGSSGLRTRSRLHDRNPRGLRLVSFMIVE